VAGMEEIENAVRERDPPLPFRPPTRGLRPCCNFRRRISGCQSLLAAVGWKWITRSFLKGSFTTSS
jgi:hypothetical protein